MEVHERIANRRKELDISADRVAEVLGVSRATIYRYESAYIEKIPVAILASLAAVLRTTPAYLLGLVDDPNADINSSHAEKKLDTISGDEPGEEHRDLHRQLMSAVADLDVDALRMVVRHAEFLLSEQKK
jgi:transcriptional regulator with XRE-family HTH domain